MENAIHLATTILEEIPLENLELMTKVQRALEASGYPEMQQIAVIVHHSVVSLHGRVSSYYQKQVAQELVKRIPNVPSVRNEILVASK
jgi:osmotically-inducible protein OsmY